LTFFKHGTTVAKSLLSQRRLLKIQKKFDNGVDTHRLITDWGDAVFHFKADRTPPNNEEMLCPT